jgi:hypothetical protein
MSFGASTLTSASGAVSDLFAGEGLRAKAEGDRLEATNYDRASVLATQNEKFTETSTAIKQAQLDRENFKMIGGQQADIAGAGFAASGSALDLLRDSAQQGALTKAIGAEQGLITEAGYTEQADSYTTMAKAARMAADADENAATGATITGAIKGITAIASLFTGGGGDSGPITLGGPGGPTPFS